MPEYLKFRCCMCPQKLDSGRICPGIPGILHPNPTPCRFVKVYQDKRGWRYFVRSGIGANTFKTFYRNPKQAGFHGWRSVPWRDSFDAVQSDLNIEAEKRGWEEVNDNPPDDGLWVQAETPTRASREPATREYCKAPLDIDRSFKIKNWR